MAWRLNCPHSIFSHARPGHAEGVLGDRTVAALARAVTPRGFNLIPAERVISRSFGTPSPLSCDSLLVRKRETGMAVQIESLSLRRPVWLGEHFWWNGVG
jgi:hypothetical protein